MTIWVNVDHFDRSNVNLVDFYIHPRIELGVSLFYGLVQMEVVGQVLEMIKWITYTTAFTTLHEFRLTDKITRK